MSKKKFTAPVKTAKRTKQDPKDEAENRKFLMIMAAATLLLILALYFIFGRN